MTLQEIKEVLDAEVVFGHEQLGMEVKYAGCADLMADVLFFGKEGMVLLTGLTSSDIVNTAYTVGITAVVVVRGKRPPLKTIQLAEELQMPLLLTKFLLFEAVGRLYAKGLAACTEKAGE